MSHYRFVDVNYYCLFSDVELFIFLTTNLVKAGLFKTSHTITVLTSNQNHCTLTRLTNVALNTYKPAFIRRVVVG